VRLGETPPFRLTTMLFGDTRTQGMGKVHPHIAWVGVRLARGRRRPPNELQKPRRQSSGPAITHKDEVIKAVTTRRRRAHVVHPVGCQQRVSNRTVPAHARQYDSDLDLPSSPGTTGCRVRCDTVLCAGATGMACKGSGVQIPSAPPSRYGFPAAQQGWLPSGDCSAGLIPEGRVSANPFTTRTVGRLTTSTRSLAGMPSGTSPKRVAVRGYARGGDRAGGGGAVLGVGVAAAVRCGVLARLGRSSAWGWCCCR
jgi:hypothetical protein